MYYPYLRGKMYELLAVRELIENRRIGSNYVSPIIEPVRDNSTFNSLLKVAKKEKYELNIISNPEVGEYKDLNQLQRLIKANGMRNSVIVLNEHTLPVTQNDLLFYRAPVKIINDGNKSSIKNVVPDNLIYRQKLEIRLIQLYLKTVLIN